MLSLTQFKFHCNGLFFFKTTQYSNLLDDEDLSKTAEAQKLFPYTV